MVMRAGESDAARDEGATATETEKQTGIEATVTATETGSEPEIETPTTVAAKEAAETAAVDAETGTAKEGAPESTTETVNETAPEAATNGTKTATDPTEETEIGNAICSAKSRHIGTEKTGARIGRGADQVGGETVAMETKIMSGGIKRIAGDTTTPRTETSATTGTKKNAAVQIAKVRTVSKSE